MGYRTIFACHCQLEEHAGQAFSPNEFQESQQMHSHDSLNNLDGEVIHGAFGNSSLCQDLGVMQYSSVSRTSWFLVIDVFLCGFLGVGDFLIINITRSDLKTVINFDNVIISSLVGFVIFIREYNSLLIVFIVQLHVTTIRFLPRAFLFCFDLKNLCYSFLHA